MIYPGQDILSDSFFLAVCVRKAGQQTANAGEDLRVLADIKSLLLCWEEHRHTDALQLLQEDQTESIQEAE